MLFQEHEETVSLWVRMQVFGLANNMKLFYLFINHLDLNQIQWRVIFIITICNHILLQNIHHPSYSYDGEMQKLGRLAHLQEIPLHRFAPVLSHLNITLFSFQLIFSIPLDKPKAEKKWATHLDIRMAWCHLTSPTNMSILLKCPKSLNRRPLCIRFACCKCKMVSAKKCEN